MKGFRALFASALAVLCVCAMPLTARAAPQPIHFADLNWEVAA